MFKIFRKNCCGFDVHKTWIYACIGITDTNGRTDYNQARFSLFSKGLRDLAASIQNKEQRLRKSISGLAKGSRERNKKPKELKALCNQQVTMSCSQPMDSSFRRIFYQRYADDFLIGVIGSRQDAFTTKQLIQSFLLKELHLELSEEKTLATHGYEKAQFLGYEITIGRKDTPSRDKPGKLSDRHHGRSRLYLPDHEIFRIYS